MNADEWEQELERDLERGSFWITADAEKDLAPRSDCGTSRRARLIPSRCVGPTDAKERAQAAEWRALEWELIAEDNSRRADKWCAAYKELAAKQATESLPWERRFMWLLGLTVAGWMLLGLAWKVWG